MLLRVGLLVTVVTGMSQTVLRGQECIGIPTSDGERHLAARVGFSEGANSYGAEFGANLTGPLSVRFRGDFIDFDDFDDGGWSVSGEGAIQAGSALPVPVCPVFGLSYAGVQDADFNVLTFHAGAGIGGPLSQNTAGSFIVYAVPQLLVNHISVDTDFVEDSETETDFGAELGATLAGARVFGTVALFVSTIDDGTSFELGIGALF
jgi:hypothetical protein